MFFVSAISLCFLHFAWILLSVLLPGDDNNEKKNGNGTVVGLLFLLC